MPKYLAVAEKVYKNIKKDSLFTDDITQNLNCLVSQIRKAIKGTEFKLKFNYIDFEENLTKPLSECKVQIDLSVMPKFANEGEIFFGWLESPSEVWGPPQKDVIKDFYSGRDNWDLGNDRYCLCSFFRSKLGKVDTVEDNISS